MNLYTTIIQAICLHTGKLTTYCGPHVPGISFADAQNYCETHELGYCKVEGVLVAEIPCKEGTHDPDWDNMVNYDQQRIN